MPVSRAVLPPSGRRHPSSPPLRLRLAGLLGRLRLDRRAISAVEFAMVAPVLSAAGLGTIELANMATTAVMTTHVLLPICLLCHGNRSAADALSIEAAQ